MRDGGGLALTDGQELVPLRSLGDDRCLGLPPDGDGDRFLVEFLRDADGVVRHLFQRGRVARRVAA